MLQYGVVNQNMLWSKQKNTKGRHMENTQPLRIVVYKEQDKFIAQCVDFDIATQADDFETLKSRMDCLLECELRAASDSGQAVDQAPQKFHNMWKQNARLADSANEYKEVAA